MEFSDSTSPERALFCREEEDGGRQDIYCAFQGQMVPPAAPENGAHFQGRLMAPAAPGNRIFRGR